MKRVVVTGLGIVSSIGNNKEEVLKSLQEGKSGIVFHQEYKDLGFRTNVHGSIDIDLSQIPKKAKRFMGDAAAYNYIAMRDAIEDAGLSEEQVSNIRTGLVTGSGGASTENSLASTDILRNKSLKRVGPYMVPRTMASTTSACLATPFKIKGINYSISSACATSSHCIGNGYEQIQMGKQDIVFAGGGEELHWTMTLLFDALGALSSKYADKPETSSRAYDANRDGFVISGGGGILVLEELEHAKARGAKIYAELVGYGATSDGHDMVQPSGEGAVRCMRMAMQDVEGPIDYINTHGTSTPVGDTKELEAIKEVFQDTVPTISSTKSLTGHALGAAGVNEAIYSILMMENDFIAGSANIEELDEAAEGLPIATEKQDAKLNTIMSNSFGFGGTNATLVFSRYND
ncbi:MAG: beta-ketoacyl-ACP synthase I [Methylococcales bacterium]|nr:beta-ketoacyl-ACP synthase I [Methylococcales bacterium]MBT7442904.1 beta-ketoacyl-ACP synthase I [Methylococcales bacterium]